MKDSQTFPVEQNVRFLVNSQLKNLGWNIERGKECNVFLEQPRTNDEKKKLNGKRPDYVLYSSDPFRKEPLIIIETKKPGTNLDDALQQGEKYAKTLGAPMIFATDGIYYKTLHTQKHMPLYMNGEEVDELIRELEAIKFLEDNEIYTISKKVIYDRRELIKIFEEANNLLRDEGFRAGIERFGEFANILFLKLIGELEDLKEEEGRRNEIKLPKHLRWSNWKDKKGNELLDYVNDTVLVKIGELYKDEAIFTPLKIKNPTILKKIIDKLNPLNLINIDSDIKGDAFEYFLKQSTATKNDLGEYFTPRHIVKVMVKLINPQIGETIYDPFCGTGGTLIESFKHISHNMARTNSNWEQLREKTLFGNEITTTARITKMNMILIGDGHSGVQQKNSLENPIDDRYDIVITNMPYSQKTECGAYYDLPNTNGDSICIQHCIKAINKSSENGRMAIVVPEGFLFRKDLQKTREYLLNKCVLKSIISLPQGVFLPYTGVKTNILYCINIKQKKKQDKIWYFDVKNDGYSLDNHRKKVEGRTDLQKFLEYREPQDQKEALQIGFSQIDIEDVKQNDYNLVGSRYKKTVDYSSVRFNIVKIKDIADIISGFAFESKFFNESKGIPLIRIRNLKDGTTDTYYNGDYRKDYLVNSGELLIGMDGEFNACIWKGETALLNQRICKLHNFKNAIKDYVFYTIQKALKNIEDNTPQTTVKHISVKQILDIEIPLPSVEQQMKIVEELNSYDAIADSAKNMVKSYKSRVEIKDEWKYKKLSEIAKIVMGQSPEGKYYNRDSKGLPFYQGKSEFGEIYLQKPTIWTTQIKKEANKNDILMSIRAPVGPVNLSPQKICIGRGLCSIKPDKNVNYLFLFYYLRNIEDSVASLSTGSTFQAINKKEIENILIPIPALNEQEDIVRRIDIEKKIITASEDAITLFQNKIKNKLDFIWGG